jgi:hypothetical protein
MVQRSPLHDIVGALWRALTELVVLDNDVRHTRPAPSLVATFESYLRFGWTF